MKKSEKPSKKQSVGRRNFLKTAAGSAAALVASAKVANALQPAAPQ